MKSELNALLATVAIGRSVVFAPNIRVAEKLASEIKATQVPVRRHLDEDVPLATLNDWNLGDRFKPKGVLMLVTPMFATGVRLRADRAVWVGRVPEETSYRYGIYSQSMSRCDSATRMCDRFHYLSGELQGA